MQPFQNHSSWWLGRAPQHPLSRPSSFHGGKHGYRFDVMQTFNNVQLNGWSCSPKHGPAHITVLSQLFVRMAWMSSITFKFWTGSCSPKQSPVPFTVLKNFFIWMLCSLFENIQVDGWAALPNILCHGPVHFAALNMFLFWCYADSQQRSNERLVVLPQTRFSSYHGVESTFCPDGSKLFKNIPNLGWVVLPQTRPSSFHGVAKPFCFDVMQPFQKLSSWWLGRAPQHPPSRPSSFHGGKHGYRFDVVQTFNNVQMNGWSCFPKHGPAQITVLSQLFVRMAWSFLKTFEILDGSCSPKHGPILFTVLKNLFVWVLCSLFKNIQVDGWVALPNIPCHGPAHFTALNKVFFLMLCRFSTAFKWTDGRASPNTVQLNSRYWVNFSSGWREAFQKHSKLRLGRAPPNTAQFLPWCWRTFSSGCYAAFSKTFKLMAGPRFPTSLVTAQIISRR